MRIDREVFYELMENTKRARIAEEKLRLLERDLNELIENTKWLVDEKQLKRTMKVYFGDKTKLETYIENIPTEKVIEDV